MAVADRTIGKCPQHGESARIGCFLYAGNRDEPPHIHVERDDGEAKFWLDPVRLARSYGFAANEINKIERLIVEYEQDLLDSWNEFFNG